YLHNIVYSSLSSFFFKTTTPTAIYTLSLHDALPIYPNPGIWIRRCAAVGIVASSSLESSALILSIAQMRFPTIVTGDKRACRRRSEEHTSELQSRSDLVCRLLLEKKKNNNTITVSHE